MRRGFTTVGPHRDDLAIRAEVETDGPERDLRAYGSGGQKRTAAIALRLVEADSLRDAKGREPVYLLDDVFRRIGPGSGGKSISSVGGWTYRPGVPHGTQASRHAVPGWRAGALEAPGWCAGGR